MRSTLSRVAVGILAILGWAAVVWTRRRPRPPHANCRAAVLSLPFVWLAVRETRGKTLEQM